MGKKDNRINDDISNLMANGMNQSPAVATALDLARKKHRKLKPRKKPTRSDFYETSINTIEPDNGRVKTGRTVLMKKPKMRHGQY